MLKKGQAQPCPFLNRNLPGLNYIPLHITKLSGISSDSMAATKQLEKNVRGYAMKILAKTKESTHNRITSLKPVREVVYPDSDGKPMADNTKQFNWIVKIKENLEIMLADNPDVFVAGDLLWYPVEGNNKIRCAPDAMVAFGRPKGDRGSYRTWEEGNIVPQVVFEVLSPGNTKKEMERKLRFYETYGVEEYYEYDPDRVKLKGWIRKDNQLSPIEKMDGWISPVLKICFDMSKKELEIIRPDGQRFLSPLKQEQKHQAELMREKQRANELEEKLKALTAMMKQMGMDSSVVKS